MVLFVCAFMKTRDRDCKKACKKDECRPKRHYEWILFSLALFGVVAGIVVATDLMTPQIQSDDNRGSMAHVKLMRSFVR